jgi:hypothetical protein
MGVSRRTFLAGGAGAALAAAGVYELVDQLAAAPNRAAAAAATGPEQHLLGGVRVVHSDGIEVLVPPLHHQIVTLRVQATTPAQLRAARTRLSEALASLDGRYPATPAGLGVTVAWGLPYFRRLVGRPAARYLPVDRRASKAKGRRVPVLLDAMRFPSDSKDVVLEHNDAALLLRSDSLSRIADGAKTLVTDLSDVWRATSIRRGFVGGGFEGGPGLPRQLAQAAGVPGADLIPHGSELFLGFTSTQKASLGPGAIANLETLGYSDAGPGGYFRGGTTMHLSHIFEDLEGWYLTFDYQDRLATIARPGVKAKRDTQTVPQDPRNAASQLNVRTDYARGGTIGHSAAIQTASRLQRDVRGSDGVLYRKGTAVPQRADFNSVDNPFAWTADPARDGSKPGAAASLHFVVFHPTSDDFHRTRLAMDGVLPDGPRLQFDPGSRQQGINSVLTTTHRQNFLVPPRRHRAFPLVELL